MDLLFQSGTTADFVDRWNWKGNCIMIACREAEDEPIPPVMDKNVCRSRVFENTNAMNGYFV